MPISFRAAGILTALFAICGPTWGQEIAPVDSGVSIQKLVIDIGSSHTVKYYVKGGSPRLQALVRRVEWAENELSVIEQLQRLKLDTVVNERLVMAARSAQLTNPYVPPGFFPSSFGADCGGAVASPLQKGLARQLAYEATPQSALQMIGYMEQVQTQLDAELKALPPKERKAAQVPIDALRPKLAALPQGDDPAPPHPPVAQRSQGGSTANAAAGTKATIEVEWGGAWYAAEILQVSGGLTLIHYTGWNSSWDEWVPASRIRRA